MSGFILLVNILYMNSNISLLLRSNYLGLQFFAAFYNTTVASLSTRCREVLGIDSNGRRLNNGLQLFDLDVNWGPLSIQGVVEESMKLEKEILMRENESMDKLEALEMKEDNIRDTLDAMMANVNSIMMKLDMDPVVPDPLNDSKSKKSKKAKQAKPEVPDESYESDLFTRNLLAVEEVVKDKFNMMESKVESIESKVGSMEGKIESMGGKIESMKSQGNSIGGQVKSIESKVESIEGKVESIEKTMEELKDMLSQLMMRGADVA